MHCLFFQGKPACACADCEATCPVPPAPSPPPKPFIILGNDGYVVVMFTVFIVGSMLFLMGVCLFPSKKDIGKFQFNSFVLVLTSLTYFFYCYDGYDWWICTFDLFS